VWSITLQEIKKLAELSNYQTNAQSQNGQNGIQGETTSLENINARDH
jgi:hypothetical protein